MNYLLVVQVFVRTPGGSKFNRRRQIKISLGALSPIEYRKSLGLAA